MLPKPPMPSLSGATPTPSTLYLPLPPLPPPDGLNAG